jgi:hypothetical protein
VDTWGAPVSADLSDHPVNADHFWGFTRQGIPRSVVMPAASTVPVARGCPSLPREAELAARLAGERRFTGAVPSDGHDPGGAQRPARDAAERQPATGVARAVVVRVPREHERIDPVSGRLPGDEHPDVPDPLRPARHDGELLADHAAAQLDVRRYESQAPPVVRQPNGHELGPESNVA